MGKTGLSIPKQEKPNFQLKKKEKVQRVFTQKLCASQVQWNGAKGTKWLSLFGWFKVFLMIPILALAAMTDFSAHPVVLA